MARNRVNPRQSRDWGSCLDELTPEEWKDRLLPHPPRVVWRLMHVVLVFYTDPCPSEKTRDNLEGLGKTMWLLVHGKKPELAAAYWENRDYYYGTCASFIATIASWNHPADRPNESIGRWLKEFIELESRRKSPHHYYVYRGY